MPSKLNIIGHDGSSFDWLNPQDGMELLTGFKVITSALYSRDDATTNNYEVEESKNIYELLYFFKLKAEHLFNKYIRKNLAIGEIIPDYNNGGVLPDESLGLSWGYLENATGEDLSFIYNLNYNEIPASLIGHTFDKKTLTILYNIFTEFSEYIAKGHNILFDSYASQWCSAEDISTSNQCNSVFTYAFGHMYDGDQRNQQEMYDDLIRVVNEPSYWIQQTGGAYYVGNQFVGCEKFFRDEFPSEVGGRYRTYYTGQNSDINNFYLLGTNFNTNIRLCKSVNFGHPARRTGGDDFGLAGEFRGVIPNENTIYKQYLWGDSKYINGSPTQQYYNFGSNINNLELSIIQQAYSADGYILRTDPIEFDYTNIQNEIPVDKGFRLVGLRTFNVDDERFTDYYTE